ncbi:MAG TPA: ABC transporter permease, partial [Burkholderiales bacterium]
IYHTRGVVAGIVTAEAIRIAQSRFGKGKPITGEQMRWGIENLNIDEKRLKELGAVGMMPPIKVSCMDHEGSGLVKFQQWDGAKWKVITDWMEPDRKLVRQKVEDDARQYAKEKNIEPRDCAKEN